MVGGETRRTLISARHEQLVFSAERDVDGAIAICHQNIDECGEFRRAHVFSRAAMP